MKKALYWLAVNIGFAATLWFGFWQGIEGAQYVAKFFVWAWCLPLGLIVLCSDDIQKRLAEMPENKLFRSIDRAIAWAALGTFVWTGHIATGAAWGIWMICAAATVFAVQKLRKAPKAATPNQNPTTEAHQ